MIFPLKNYFILKLIFKKTCFEYSVSPKSEEVLKKQEVEENRKILQEHRENLKKMIETCKALHEGFDEKRREVRAEKSKKIRELTDPNHAWGGGFEDAPEAEAVTEIEAEAAPIPSAAEPALVAEKADIEEKAAAAGYHKYKALYDYEARNEDELSFSINDIIMVHPEQEHEPGWLGGELNGKIGWFPEAYAKRCGDGIELSLQPIAEVSETGSENGSFQVKIFSLNLSKVFMPTNFFFSQTNNLLKES